MDVIFRYRNAECRIGLKLSEAQSWQLPTYIKSLT
jgi:hypothetical protein